MSPLSKKIVNQSFARNPARVEELVRDALNQKALERIEANRRDISADILRLDPIEELSKKKLGSYAAKAVDNLQHNAGMGGYAQAAGLNTKDPGLRSIRQKEQARYDRNANNRNIGLKRATSRLAKEGLEPRVAGEKAFVKLHKVDKHPHPVARENQFTSDLKKAKRRSDQDVGDADGIKDDASSTVERLKNLTVRAMGVGYNEEREPVQELTKATLGSYTRKASTDLAFDFPGLHRKINRYVGIARAQYRLDGSKPGYKFTKKAGRRQRPVVGYTTRPLWQNKESVEHPGFKAVQSKIEGEGYSKDQAGAILASRSRNASRIAKKHNSHLKRVKG